MGYYVGQLHFYHATFMATALFFFGALCEACDAVPGATAASLAVIRNIFGPLYLLFFAATLLPQLLAFMAEIGPRRAVHSCIVSILSGSPLFFAFQSRAIGHHVSGEFASGGATYIATGRGVALSRQPFVALYTSFSTACTYPGIELASMLAIAVVLADAQGGSSVDVFVWLTAAVTPLSLLFAPAIFNPRCFELRAQLHDMRAWLTWLTTSDPSDKNGWRAYHDGLIAKRRGAAVHSFVLPSKEYQTWGLNPGLASSL